jgi:hypothetical protein
MLQPPRYGPGMSQGIYYFSDSNYVIPAYQTLRAEHLNEELFLRELETVEL